jgi:hypothetical protein
MATDNAAPAVDVEDFDVMSISEKLVGLDELAPTEADPKTDAEEEKLSDNDESDESEAEKPAEESEDEDAKESDDEESEDDDAPVPQEKVQKRIDKLTAKRKEAEEKAQTLETEYSAAKTKLAELARRKSAAGH